MFGGTWTRSRTPIGVDVGARCVRLMQLERRGEGYAALAVGERLLPAGLKPGDEYHRAVSDAIAGLLSNGSFQGRRCVSCLPASEVQYKNLRLPRMPDEELLQAVQWEANDRLRLSGEPLSIQFYDAGEVRQGDEARREVILLAAPVGFVERHTRSLVDAGLEPVAVDAVPSALRRCVGLLPSGPGSAAGGDDDDDNAAVRVVIDAGYAGSKVLITRGSRIVFFKLVPVGGKRFDEAASDSLQVPLDEAVALRRQLIAGEVDSRSRSRVAEEVITAMRPLVVELGRELSLCLRYYGVTFRGRRPDEVLLVGGEAMAPGLPEMLGDCAGVTVRPTDPLAPIDLARVEGVVAGLPARAAWATAAGLALRPERASRLQGAAA